MALPALDASLSSVALPQQCHQCQRTPRRTRHAVSPVVAVSTSATHPPRQSHRQRAEEQQQQRFLRIPRRVFAAPVTRAAAAEPPATATAASQAAAASSTSSLASTPAVPFFVAASDADDAASVSDSETHEPATQLNLAAFPASSGVYAVFDGSGALQYMGLSRRLNASLAVHAEEVPELCHSVKWLVVNAPDRASLLAAWKAWMEEHVAATGSAPPGNESGNPTWTTRKPKRSKPEIRLTPGPNTKLTVPLEELIDKLVKEHRVVAFVKGTRTEPACGFSHRVLTILNEARVDYEVLNVLDEDHNPGLREAIKTYSQWPTIPQLYVDGEFVGGADILNEMAEKGEINTLLAPKRKN